MVRGVLEIVEFVPRHDMVDADPVNHASKSAGVLSRLRLEHRTLTSCAAALMSVALHAFFIGPAFWGNGRSQHPVDRTYAGNAAMEWVILDESPAAAAMKPASPSAPALVAIGLSDALPLPLPASGSSAEKDAQPEDRSSLGVMYGRYIGQIHARIDRSWQRPRTAIGAPIFDCQVQVDQDGVGQVGEITLRQCNGDSRWRLSLVHAIEAASPFPAPPNPAAFTRRVLLEFRAMAYSPEANAQLYEPAAMAETQAGQGEAGTQVQNSFQVLRDAVRAPHSHGTVELRIEGSTAEVEPEHQ